MAIQFFTQSCAADCPRPCLVTTRVAIGPLPHVLLQGALVSYGAEPQFNQSNSSRSSPVSFPWPGRAGGQPALSGFGSMLHRFGGLGTPSQWRRQWSGLVRLGRRGRARVRRGDWLVARARNATQIGSSPIKCRLVICTSSDTHPLPCSLHMHPLEGAGAFGISRLMRLCGGDRTWHGVSLAVSLMRAGSRLSGRVGGSLLNGRSLTRRCGESGTEKGRLEKWLGNEGMMRM